MDRLDIARQRHRVRDTERYTQNSNSKTLFFKDCNRERERGIYNKIHHIVSATYDISFQLMLYCRTLLNEQDTRNLFCPKITNKWHFKKIRRGQSKTTTKKVPGPQRCTAVYYLMFN